MPIYKVASPLPVFGAKYRGFEVSQSASTPHGHNGSGEIRLIQEDNAGQIKDMERGHALPSPPEVQHQIEPTHVVVGPGRRETLIEREVREQLRREAELASQQGSPSFAEDPDATKRNIRVISSSDENGGRSDRNHHHATPDTSVGLSREGAVVDEQRTVVVVSTSPDGGVHRTTTTTTTTTTGSGGGGGSVKTGSVGTPFHGGSWILHELQTQAAREKELRTHRKEMGWEVEGRREDDDGEMDKVRYSGGTWADQRVELGADVVDSRASEEHTPAVPDILVEGPGDNDATLSFDYNHHHPKSPASGRRNTQKVQPFEDVERIQSEIQMIYVPQNETPIDREIRLQREREEALRFSRGIFSTVHGSSPEIEVEVLRPRPIEEGGGPNSGDLGLSMKKFAESRLRNELEREKKRELDLLKEGKIIVLSADRTPDAMTFVEVISPEKVELRELARKISAERQSGVNDAASKEMAWNEVTLRDSTTPRNVASNEMSWHEMTSRDSTAPRNAASNEMSWQEVTARNPTPRNVPSKEITSHNSAPRVKTWNNVTPKETTTKKVVLVELPQKENHDPFHVEVHNGHGNDDKAFVDAKVHTPSPPKTETHLTVTRSTERSGKGMKSKAVSPNSYSEEDVQKILLTVAEQRIEDEIAETKKRELELRELRKHRLISETPREPEDINNNAHAQSSVSVKIETDHKSPPSPQPIRDVNQRDDVTEVHVTTAFDNVDFGDVRAFQQQPIDGQGEFKARRLALIDQWERGIVQRSD